MSRAHRSRMIETELKSFAVRDFLVEFDEEGELVAARHRRWPDRPYVTGLRLGSLRLGGQSVPWSAGKAVVDSDEVERSATIDGIASVVLRHTFAPAWRTRLALRNTATETWTGRLALTLRPGPGCRAWSLDAGRDSTYALLAVAHEAPILVAHTTSGSAMTITEHRFELGPLTLDPGLSFVAAWDWRSADSPRALADRLPGTLPWVLTAPVGEEIWLPADRDTAVLIPDDLELIDDQGHRTAVADRPGRHRVELRSARGSTVLDLAWVRPASEFLAATAEHILTGPRGPSGVVGLADLPAALVLQWATRQTGFGATVDADDALDLFTARLDHSPSESGRSPALEISYLAGEYDRLGDPDLLDAGDRRMSATTTVIPGLGLAVMRLRLASILAGRRPGPPPPAEPGRLDPYSSASAAAAVLEYALATQTPDHITSEEALSLLYRVGIELRAGLPGRVPVALPTEQLSHCLAVLRLLPDTVNPYWMDRFGLSINTLVDARTLELIDRLSVEAAAPVTTAHAWLAVSS